MKSCCHCGAPIEKGDFCTACEWIHLGLCEKVEQETVIAARYILCAFDQHYIVNTVNEVHQLMVDLMYGSEDDEKIMTCVGMLRNILAVAVVKELAERGYGPDGLPLEVTQ